MALPASIYVHFKQNHFEFIRNYLTFIEIFSPCPATTTQTTTTTVKPIFCLQLMQGYLIKHVSAHQQTESKRVTVFFAV